MEEKNCGPRSKVIVTGTRNRDIEVDINAFAQSTDEIVESGTASSQRVVLSMIVKMWEKPEEWGIGPTRSICTWLKHLAGVGMVNIRDLVWCVTFPLWQFRPDLVHRVTSLDVLYGLPVARDYGIWKISSDDNLVVLMVWENPWECRKQLGLLQLLFVEFGY